MQQALRKFDVAAIARVSQTDVSWSWSKFILLQADRTGHSYATTHRHVRYLQLTARRPRTDELVNSSYTFKLQQELLYQTRPFETDSMKLVYSQEEQFMLRYSLVVT